MNETEIDAVDADAGNVPEPKNIDDISSSGESQKSDGAEIAAPDSQGSHGLAGDAAGNGHLVSAEEASSIYEATGLTGPFKLNPMGMAFPETSNEDLMALAANVKAIGIMEEPTVAWTQGTENPPEVIDGKRIIQAAEIAGVQPTYRILRRDIDPRDYVWAKNRERRNLSTSQKALAFALLYAKLGPGRPPGPAENCQLFDSFPQPTQGQGARKLKISRPLINDAYKVADPHGRVTPEVREAVRQGIVTVSDAVKDNVGDAAPDVQREALSLVKDGSSRTMAAAVERVEKEESERQGEPLVKLDRPKRLGKNLVLHSCSVDRLKRGLKPGTIDLVLAHLPDYVRLGFFYKIAELADHVLNDAGVLVVVWAGGPLREVIDGLSRGARGMNFIADFPRFSLLPSPNWNSRTISKFGGRPCSCSGNRERRCPKATTSSRSPPQPVARRTILWLSKTACHWSSSGSPPGGRLSVSPHSRTTAAPWSRRWQPVAPSSPPTRSSRSSTTS